MWKIYNSRKREVLLVIISEERNWYFLSDVYDCLKTVLTTGKFGAAEDGPSECEEILVTT